MTKKIILLIIALPLFLMICLFTATSGISLAVPIGVSGIELLSESIVYLDMDNPRDKHLVEYAIYPTNAANQEVTFSYLPLVDENGKEEVLAKFEYDEETGYLKPLAPGAAEVVITTVDGGFTARFTAVVETRELISIESTPNNNLEATFDEALDMNKYSLAPGDDFKIQNSFYPETAKNLLVDYSSSNPAVATVDRRGVVQARSEGTAIITVSSRINEHINYSFALEIVSPDDQTFVILDNNVITFDNMGEIDLSITTDEEYSISFAVVDKDGNPVTDETASYINLNYVSDSDGDYISYVISPKYFGTFLIDVTLTLTESGESSTIRCSISRIEISDESQIIFELENNYYDTYAQTSEIYFRLYPISESWDVEFEVSFNNDNVALDSKQKEVIDLGGGYYSIIINPKLIGTSIMTITATYKAPGDESSKEVTAELPIVVKPNRILAHNPVVGIEDAYTIGKYNADGTLYSYKLDYTVNGNFGEGFYENLKWVSNNDAVYVNEDGEIVFVEGKDIADFVTFTVKYYCGDTEVMSSQSIKIRCVSDGYNVHSYKELLEVTRAGKVVVLQDDIVHDFGADLEKSTNLESANRKDKNVVLLPADQLYTTMKSTYDTTWYENAGREKDAYIKVLISFKNDVYGNDHIISADNVVSYGQSASYAENGQPHLTANAIFRGPLSFVALNAEGNEGTSGEENQPKPQGSVSVAGQDNVCFAVFEGVTLNGVQLKGREMDPQQQTDGSVTYELQNLHYAGTVVEVFGDDVTIEYSRISNGRNVVRAFGYDNDPNKAIHLTVKNSVLSNGRDFIMRLGSNRFADIDLTSEDNKLAYGVNKDTLSPYLPDKNTTDKVNYENRHNYGSFTDDEKTLYDTQFINTFVRIENSVLQDPGIFGIGVDTHFAGQAIEDGSTYQDFVGGVEGINYWKNLAKTSYGVKLTLAGDVRMYCWKVLDEVDSSSLIEMSAGFSMGFLSEATLAFDIPSLVRGAVNKNKNLEKAIYNAEVEAEAKKTGSSWKSVWAASTDMQKYDKVHAGIAFFGGGKNYGVLDYDGKFGFYEFSKPYEIALSDAGKSDLEIAAGKEPFYFVIYDATTLNFLYETQEEMRSNPDEAHSCIKKEFAK